MWLFKKTLLCATLKQSLRYTDELCTQRKRNVSQFASLCSDKTLTDIILVRKGFIWLTFPYYSLSLGSPARSLVAGTKAETMEAAFWLAPHGLFSLSFYTAQAHLPRGDTAHSGPGPPTSLLTKTVPHRHACSLRDTYSQWRFPLPDVSNGQKTKTQQSAYSMNR